MNSYSHSMVPAFPMSPNRLSYMTYYSGSVGKEYFIDTDNMHFTYGLGQMHVVCINKIFIDQGLITVVENPYIHPPKALLISQDSTRYISEYPMRGISLKDEQRLQMK